MHLDVYEPIEFKLGMMIGTIVLYILIVVSSTSALIQGHLSARNTKTLCKLSHKVFNRFGVDLLLILMEWSTSHAAWLCHPALWMMLHTHICPRVFPHPLVGYGNAAKMCVTRQTVLLTQVTIRLVLSWPVAVPGKHCCYRQCEADSQYPDQHSDAFFPFPKPYSMLEVRNEWI